MLPLLYVVRMDVEPDYLSDFVAWYDTRHGPDLIGTGFHSCNAYHSFTGSPFICNVYEITQGVLESDAYVAVREHDRQLVDEVLHKISNHSNTVYSQEIVIDVPTEALRADDRPSRAGAVSAPVVSTVRLELDGDALDGFERWYRDEEAAAQRERPGFLRARVGRQSTKHPLFPSKQPEWIVLTEWANEGDATADGPAEEVLGRYERGLGDGVSGLEYTVGGLSATLLNSTNWTT
jgi:hypothetical protein